MINLKKQVTYWQDSAKRNFQAAQVLFRNKHYDSCLFFCHLSIEKMLKGLVVIKTKQTPPYIHKLRKIGATVRVGIIARTGKNTAHHYGF